MEHRRTTRRIGETHMSNVIEVKELCKTYIVNKKQHHVLRNISFQIQEGEFVVIMGPSGSGKSTLLYTVSGMDSITSGSVVFEHQELHQMKEEELAKLRLHKMGFIFQQMHFLNHLDIYDNVILPAYMANEVQRKDINTYANELFQAFHIASIRNHRIQEVSGGELQRACIVRSMINHPSVLFADEPTGALNSQNAKEVMKAFTKLHRQGTTIMMVTHDVKVASYADRICYINDGTLEHELQLGAYSEEDLKQREKTVYNWLMDQGW